jgi:hypothetical protein
MKIYGNTLVLQHVSSKAQTLKLWRYIEKNVYFIFSYGKRYKDLFDCKY